jgi:hypothetical protein
MFLEKINCPYKLCGAVFTPDEKALIYTTLGRFTYCPKCGQKIIITKLAKPVLNHKEHMSKKSRLSLRKAVK